RLLEAYPLLPLGANLALVICVTSYDGGMYFGMVGDRDAIPDVNVIGRGLEHGFARLEEEAGIRKLRTARRPTTGAHVTRAKGRTKATASRTKPAAATVSDEIPVKVAAGGSDGASADGVDGGQGAREEEKQTEPA